MEVYVKNKFGIASKVEKQEQQSIEESVTVMQENSNFSFPRTARLWNSLPAECLPLTYKLLLDQRNLKHCQLVHLKLVLQGLRS